MMSARIDGPGKHLILYDGVCGLCNGLNTFVLPRDPDGLFAFTSLQSPTGQTLLTRFGKPVGDLDTFYVLVDYRSELPTLLAKSRAGLFVLATLGGVWRVAAPLGALPTPLLDVGYDLLARNRYRIFGRYDTCPLPTPEHRRRFIDV